MDSDDLDELLLMLEEVADDSESVVEIDCDDAKLLLAHIYALETTG